MRANFTNAQDKRIVALALEYESQHKRVEWKEVVRAMRSTHSVQALGSRLRVLKRTYGRDLSRFPRVHCLLADAPRLLLLHNVFLSQGDVFDTRLSSRLPFQRASIVFLNDFLFDELAKQAVQEQLYMMPRVHLIVSTSRYCPRHRDSCRRSLCSKWRFARTTYGRSSWKSPPIPIYMYTTVQ
ncbi:uncharacterized protein PITG_11640 [Phytophthora infestans T30-4]|uniref:Uncharacterized protein n=1 Tax=Phytophthora infestans (strain T30-4) TaxID=403677 RepID=D0NI83_PHYIT|nr:uncharacterized protein PITG_11640 [Phytophthora infestans T30-4]EEY59168.1 conserved hypothetical protein [Phytophthora infestans T30-4]|eukprot:XP_002901182.1 conserved hypothetical protein [Phytophthora infestans T30-4]